MFDLFFLLCTVYYLTTKGKAPWCLQGEGCNACVFVPRWMSVCMQCFVTKLGIVVHDHKPECHAKKMGFYLQGQGHSVGLYNQNMTVSITSFISSKPVNLLQPNSI